MSKHTPINIEIMAQMDYLPAYPVESGVDVPDLNANMTSSMYMWVIKYLGKAQLLGLWIAKLIAAESHHEFGKPTNPGRLLVSQKIKRDNAIQESIAESVNARFKKIFTKRDTKNINEKIADKYNHFQHALRDEAANDAYANHHFINTWTVNLTPEPDQTYMQKTLHTDQIRLVPTPVVAERYTRKKFEPEERIRPSRLIRLVSFTAAGALQAAKNLFSWTQKNNVDVLTSKQQFKIVKSESVVQATLPYQYIIYTNKNTTGFINDAFDQWERYFNQQKNIVNDLINTSPAFLALVKHQMPGYNSRKSNLSTYDLMIVSQELLTILVAANDVQSTLYREVFKLQHSNQRICELGKQLEKKDDRIALSRDDEHTLTILEWINSKNDLKGVLKTELQLLNSRCLESDMTLAELKIERANVLTNVILAHHQILLRDELVKLEIKNPTATLALRYYINNKFDSFEQAINGGSVASALLEQIADFTANLLTLMRPEIINAIVHRYPTVDYVLDDDIRPKDKDLRVDNLELEQFLDEKLAHMAQRKQAHLSDVFKPVQIKHSDLSKEPDDTENDKPESSH